MNDELVDSSIMLQLASLDRCVIFPSGAKGMYPCHAPSGSNILRTGALDVIQSGVSRAERSVRDGCICLNYPHGA
jgi:hypothetical protein